MKYTRFVNKEDFDQLQYEVISQDLKIHFTRLLEVSLQRFKGSEEVNIIGMNRVINKSRRLAGLSVYVLDGLEDDYYYPAEYAWHFGELELVFRRLDTVQFIEFMCELIEDDFFEEDMINQLFEQEGLSFRIRVNHEGDISVDVVPVEELESMPPVNEHPNIRLLIKRMDESFNHDDYSMVLHSSASIFETMAKDIVNIPGVQDQTLGSFFERYRKDSNLPSEILDYISRIYTERNTTPLAGHGSTQPPQISREQAINLVEMTKAFVKIEYRLHSEIKIKPERTIPA